ncbi:ABC transporter ATP-binding protein [Phascolarctobacterium sp.]|uniref:ABC transporter ATP-binding protein n=1 Tax=Phascolarctobacterium sp. TaxID=2049039 RepID=UPI0034C64171
MIKIRQLKIAFGDKVVLDNMDLDVYAGETLAIIGPSGTGKSTVIKVLTGLLSPNSGSVVIDGQETSGFDEEQWDALRKRMGVVFQYSALFDFLNVGDNVAFGLRRQLRLPEEEIAKRVSELLQMVGMPDTQRLLPSELSGGMKKRVGLARALAVEPQIVLYDEPTSGLDPVMTMTISRLIRKTQRQLGVTSVLVTHDMASAYSAADRIAMLYKGRIVQLGTVDEIKNSSNPVVHAFINGLERKEEDIDGQQ